MKYLTNEELFELLHQSEMKASLELFGINEPYWTYIRDRVVIAIPPKPTKEENEIFMQIKRRSLEIYAESEQVP